MPLKSHRIQVKARLCFDLDLEEGLQGDDLVLAVANALNDVVDQDGGIGIPELERGRVFPVWSSVDRRMSAREAFAADSILVLPNGNVH